MGRIEKSLPERLLTSPAFVCASVLTSESDGMKPTPELQMGNIPLNIHLVRLKRGPDNRTCLHKIMYGSGRFEEV